VKTFHLKIMILLLLFTGLLLIFQGCSIKKPEAPSWETTWDLPLTSKQYSINDIMDQLDSSMIAFDESNNPYFSITQEIDTIMVDDNLPSTNSINPQPFTQTLGERDIEAPIIPQSSFGFSDLVNPGYIALGQVPLDTAFSQDEALSAFDNFEQAQISQGILQLELTNELGIYIHSLTITLFNSDNLLSPLGAADFDTLYDDSTKVVQIDLADSLIKNELTLRVYGVVDSQAIVAPAGDLTINSSFPNDLSVSSARAKLPATPDMVLADTIDLDLETGNVIHEATIESGSLSLLIENNTGLPIDISLSVPNIEESGVPITRNTSIVENSSDSLVIELAGTVLKPDTTTDPQSIQVNAIASIATNPDSLYNINSTDSILIAAMISPIAFSVVTGQIAPTTIDIGLDPQAVDELPEGFDQAQLTRAELTMYLYNNSTSDIAVDMQLSSDQPGVDPVVIDTTVGAKGLGATVPQETVISIGSSTLSSFLNPLPTQISIDGSAVFNPSGGVVTISTDDFFYGEVEIYSPLAFSLNDTTEIELDTNDVEINSEDMPDFQETFVHGIINAELTSQLPVGARVGLKIIAAGDPNIVTVGPFTLESAITDDEGIAVEPVVSAFIDTLSSSEIAIFENENVQIIPQIELLPTGPNGSMIQGSDYIYISASAEFRVIGGEHLWNDDEN